LNVTFEELQRQHVIYVTPGIEYNKHEARGFKTRTGKVELYSQVLDDIRQDPMPVYRPFEEGPDLIRRYPLVGTTRRPGNYVHTRFRDVASLHKIQPDPLLRIHPTDADPRKIGHGDLASVESPEGAISVKVMVTDEVRPGCVIVDFGWGNSWDGGPNVNVLTSDQVRCPLSGATPNRRFRCEITRAPVA
jgi:anaerobic selenocysteine-containing dehydrogenase